MSIDLSFVDKLPDAAVLSKKQTSALTGLSGHTLDRMHERREGPTRIQLSPKVFGYRFGTLKAWMESLEKRSA